VLSRAELDRVARVLEAELGGARLEEVREAGPSEVALALYRGGGAGGRRTLRLSCDPEAGRVEEVPEAGAGAGVRDPRRPRRGARAAPPPLVALLRRRGVGARLSAAGTVAGDRHLRLVFERTGSEGPAERVELRLLLMGGRSNLLLLDRDGRLLAALRPLRATLRDAVPGQPFRAPEAPPRPAGPDRFADLPDPDLLRAIHEHYREWVGRREGEQRLAALRRAFARRRRALERKLALVEGDLAEAEAARDLRRQGELLKSALRRVRPGDREVLVRDFESGEDVRVALDPALSPVANLEQLFRRHRKATRKAARALAAKGEVEAELARILDLSRELEDLAGADDAALRRFAERPEVARIVARYAPREPSPQPDRDPRARPFGDLPKRLWPARYRSSDGLEILVGRSDEGNDVLSTRIARGRDLFCHLDGAPGSHVVIRTGGRRDVPSETLLEACELAVHFSKAKDADRADVLVAQASLVRKPKGAKAGLVQVAGGRVVHLRREPRRLERVLDSREPEDGG